MKPTPNSELRRQAVSVALMRESDAYTIAHFVSGKELMYRAAMGIYHSYSWQGKIPVIFCGGGNNGGDGYALAGILADRRIPCRVIKVSEKFSEESAFYYKNALGKNVKIEGFTDCAEWKEADVIVDCIFGTGFHGMPRGAAADAIRKINESEAYVISVDINSGMNGDTGEGELAVRSDLTVSIGFYKTGHFIGRGPELIGDLVNVDIGIVLPEEEKK